MTLKRVFQNSFSFIQTNVNIPKQTRTEVSWVIMDYTGFSLTEMLSIKSIIMSNLDHVIES